MAKRSPSAQVMDIGTRDRLNFIDGSFQIGASGKTFENRSPVDGHLLGIVHEAGREEVDKAVRAAKAALSGPWGKLNITERVELLYGVADGIDMRFDDFLAAEVEDTGKPRSLASHLDTEEEVLALANDNPYGLACAIWTENLSRAHRVAARVEVGIIWVNSWFLRDLRTPFGGSKASGIGREGGVHSLEFYTELSNVCIKL